MLLRLVCLLIVATATRGFFHSPKFGVSKKVSLNLDGGVVTQGGKWAQVATSDPSAVSRLHMAKELDPDVGYGPLGSLTRQGFVPWVIRLVRPQTYDEAVTKYVSLEKCSRLEAMANMDAYFADPNGWAGNKMRERSGKMQKIDYINANQDTSSLYLTSFWAVGIIGLGIRVFQVQVLHM